jgi:hypothetical protein
MARIRDHNRAHPSRGERDRVGGTPPQSTARNFDDRREPDCKKNRHDVRDQDRTNKATNTSGMNHMLDMWCRRRPDDYRIALDRLETPFAVTTAMAALRRTWLLSPHLVVAAT